MITRLFVALAFALLTFVAAHAQDAPASAASDVWLPGKAWALELDGTGFTTKANEIRPDRRRYFLAENTKTLVIVSVFLLASKAPLPSRESKHPLEAQAMRNASLAPGYLKRVP